MSDPWKLQGLAHFLEHMLFMGTTKYPEENAFEKVREDEPRNQSINRTNDQGSVNNLHQ